MAVKPMLDDIELKLVQKIEADGEQVFDQHGVPALEGDFLQGQGRRAERVRLVGVMTGPEAADDLKALREKYRAAAVVSFVSDIATATKVGDVLIEEFGVREVAGKSQRFEYELTLRELIPAPPTTFEVPPPPRIPEIVITDVATLVVEVFVEGRPDFDFSTVVVTVEGRLEDGTPLTTRTLTNRLNNVWTEDDFPPGEFTARAEVSAPERMSGTAPAAVRRGETTVAQITLRPGAAGAVVAEAFVVHFRFDKAFIEPCMREVLREVMARAADPAKANERVLVVGHTDKTGSMRYNQSLSERRARSVYAFLTSGRDPETARAEWDLLRRQSTGGLPQIRDSWGAMQYQYMLQDLGFYHGNVDGDHGPKTNEAVQSYRAAKRLPPGTQVDDAVWSALIADYMAQDADVMLLPESKLLPEAKDACNGGALKWLGCGEQQPLPTPFDPPTNEAWRPYRRVEILFVEAERLPCDPPKPDTFDLFPPGRPVNSTWCFGPPDLTEAQGADRACFGSRECDAPGQPADHWCIRPVETELITIRGSFKFEDGSPAPNIKYILLASDGEFMDGEVGQGPATPQATPPGRLGRGEGFRGRSGPDGRFEYSPNRDKPVGICIVEVQEPFVARLEEDPPNAAKGNVICKRLDGSSDFNIILGTSATSLEFVQPNNPDALVASIGRGGTMRVRADIPGQTGDTVTVRITGDRVLATAPGGGTGPPPATTGALELVEAANVENAVAAVRAGDRVRVRVDAPGTAGDTLTVNVDSLLPPSPTP
ncbi:MAG: OmpA family protein [Pyrinomonadaceae bacterium]